MWQLKLPENVKSKKRGITDREKLAAYAEHAVQGRNINDVAAALCAKHGVPAPKYGQQMFSAFLRKIQRKLAEGHEPTRALCREFGLELTEVPSK